MTLRERHCAQLIPAFSFWLNWTGHIHHYPSDSPAATLPQPSPFIKASSSFALDARRDQGHGLRPLPVPAGSDCPRHYVLHASERAARPRRPRASNGTLANDLSTSAVINLSLRRLSGPGPRARAVWAETRPRRHVGARPDSCPGDAADAADATRGAPASRLTAFFVPGYGATSPARRMRHDECILRAVFVPWRRGARGPGSLCPYSSKFHAARGPGIAARGPGIAAQAQYQAAASDHPRRR